MRKLYEKYLKRNIGLINLFGKSSGRVLFLLLTSFFAFKLSVKDFATFAIFWTALKMMTFLSANNFYIVYFNKVREHLLKDQKWPSDVTSNVVFTGLILSVFSSILTYFIFDSYYVAIIMLPSVLLFIAIIFRSLSIKKLFQVLPEMAFLQWKLLRKKTSVTRVIGLALCWTTT